MWRLRSSALAQPERSPLSVSRSLSLSLCAPPPPLRVCAVVHEADSLKYFKGSLFTTEISRRNCSHIYISIFSFSQRWTQQSCDSSQLHDAQAFAWTFKSAIWSCSNNKAGSDAPRANECCVGRMRSAEPRVFDQCALNPDYLSALVSGLISVTPEPLSTSRDPSSALNLRHMSMAESITGAWTGSTRSCWGGRQELCVRGFKNGRMPCSLDYVKDQSHNFFLYLDGGMLGFNIKSTKTFGQHWGAKHVVFETMNAAFVEF